MDGTNPGEDDSLALSKMNEPSRDDESLAMPLTPPISDVSQRQRDEDRARRRLLLEKLQRESIPEEPEPFPIIESDLLQPGWEWREGENGIVLPIPPPPDPDDRRIVFVRFLDHFTETGGQNRKFAPGEIVSMEQGSARKLLEMRRFGFPPESWPASVEYATEVEYTTYQDLLPEIEKNEVVTAKDPLSQILGMVSPETPKLIVRFLRGAMASEKRSCGIGEVWPVEKELAVRHLLEKEPVVELASPAELKSDRDLVDRIRETKKRWNQLGITDDQSRQFAVRYLTSGTNPKGDKCEPGEVWEVDEDHAHSLCRGRSPECELATEHELKAYRAKLIGEPMSGEPAEPVLTGKGRKKDKTKKSTAKGEARAKLISALTSHHQYSNGGCGAFKPISVNELARQAGVAPSTAGEFFKKQFKGHIHYKWGCGEKSNLITALKLLNGEFTPGILMQRHRTESAQTQNDSEND